MEMDHVSKNAYTITLKYGHKLTGHLRMMKYQDGSPALMMLCDDGREVLSVNLAGYGLKAPDGHIFVKDYSDHEGLADELVQLGIGEKVGPVRIGYGAGWLVKVVAE